MMREDYIVRQLRQFFQVLAQAVFRKQEQQYDEALKDIQDAGQLFLGLDLGAIHRLSYDDLREALQVKNMDGVEHASVVAELLHVQGECFEFQQIPERARVSYQMAVRLYLDLATSDKGELPLDLIAKTDALLGRFDFRDLERETQHLLFRYLFDQGRFAESEDVLFVLAEQPSRDLYAEGVDFYKRLMQTPYKKLQAGRLPWEEVKEGLAAFKQKMDT